MEKKKSAKKRLIIWSVVAILLVVILIIASMDFQFGVGSDYSYPNADKYQVGGFETREQIKKIEINWPVGYVRVNFSEDGEICADDESMKYEDEAKMRYLIEGDKLIIQFSESKFFKAGKELSKDLWMEIPEDIIEQLDEIEINVNSATVEVNGIGANELSVESISGEVVLADVTANELKLDSVSGDVRAERTVAKEVDVDTVSGEIALKGEFEDVDVEGTSGRVTIDTQEPIRSLNTDMVSGTVNLVIPSENGFTAEFDTVSGEFKSEYATSHKDEEYVYGDGKAEFSFSSVSGDVKIEENRISLKEEGLLQ